MNKIIALIIVAITALVDVREHRMYLPLVAKPPEPSIELGVQIEAPIRVTTESFIDGAIIKLTILWADVEGVMGVYTWPDKFEKMVEQSKGHPLVIGVRTSPSWANSDPTFICNPPNAKYYRNFANFVNAVIDRYHPIAVEIMNEPYNPPSKRTERFYGCNWTAPMYANLLDVIYPIIKNAHPNVQVWAGADGHLLDRTDTFTQFTNKFDVFSYHAYGYWADGIYDSTFIAKADVAKKYSGGKLLAISETSLLCDDSMVECNGQFEEDQSIFLEWVVENYSKDIEYLIWYTQADNGWRHSDLSYRGYLKPAWYTFRDLVMER